MPAGKEQQTRSLAGLPAKGLSLLWLGRYDWLRLAYWEHCCGLRAKIHLVLNVRLCNLKQVVCEPRLVLHEVIAMRLKANAVRGADLLTVQESNDRKA